MFDNCNTKKTKTSIYFSQIKKGEQLRLFHPYPIRFT